MYIWESPYTFFFFGVSKGKEEKEDEKNECWVFAFIYRSHFRLIFYITSSTHINSRLVHVLFRQFRHIIIYSGKEKYELFFSLNNKKKFPRPVSVISLRYLCLNWR